jgi:hypothetical protein
LLEIVTICHREFPTDTENVEALILSPIDSDPLALGFQIRRLGVGDAAAAVVATRRATKQFFTVFHLLKQYEFARDNPSGFSDVIAGPQVAVISRDAVDYLSRFISS